MNFFDILRLALRNLREAKLRVVLTTMGVVVGVTVIITMISFGLGLQRNAVQRFRDLDLFNEITVSGQDITELVAQVFNRTAGGAPPDVRRRNRENSPPMPDKPSTRVLDDAALAEIARIPGVEAVEPAINFTAYVRANDRTQPQIVGGALVPNPASRFKNFAAGRMMNAPDEVVVDSRFVTDFAYAKPADAVGQTVELLAPLGARGGAGGESGGATQDKATDGSGDDAGDRLTFFGLPLGGDDEEEAGGAGVPARTFRIAGVLQDEVESGGPKGPRRFRGLLPAARVYVPLPAARELGRQYRDPLNEVALQLARSSGALKEGAPEGYGSAVVRVSDPDVLSDVRKRLTALGFSSFSIVDELEEIRTFFLIVNSALGLLGGISLLVASFGIANTMIMAILERTREIGIMKAIGAEDREIKLIFFVEAGLIGLAGGVIGSLAAWGIDAAANRLAYRFLLRPRGVSFINFFSLPPYLWLGAIAFAIVISIIAALYPAARAARIDPVRALRHD
ncbi:MAG TPA: FtsX-like permease family protein [Pyrinomonadaceae bacterium]|jgi:ABC-type lipoprotein release transport system permease subunit